MNLTDYLIIGDTVLTLRRTPVAPVCILLSFILSFMSRAQWVRTDVPGGADVRSLCVSGNSLLAGTADGGVYRSTDNGAHWTTANTGLTGISVYIFAVSGTNLFAANDGVGVSLSTDNGATWTATNNTGLEARTRTPCFEEG